MFKQIVALVRGQSFEATEAFVDRNALTILRQQMRDSGEAVSAARRAVAIAIAQNEQETTHLKKLGERVSDLETRAIAAIDKGETDLARQAAEAIALLETQQTSSEAAQKNFATEIQRLKRIVINSEARLLELQRGERIAAATERTQRLRSVTSVTGASSLRDAEETLARLLARQHRMDAADAALAEMLDSNDPSAISRKLAEAGCGMPIENSGDAVLERLKRRATRA